MSRFNNLCLFDDGACEYLVLSPIARGACADRCLRETMTARRVMTRLGAAGHVVSIVRVYRACCVVSLRARMMSSREIIPSN